MSGYTPEVRKEAAKRPLAKLGREQDLGTLESAMASQQQQAMFKQQALQADITLRSKFRSLNMALAAEKKRNELALELERDVLPTPLEGAMYGAAAGATTGFSVGGGHVGAGIGAGIGALAGAFGAGQRKRRAKRRR